MRLRRFTLLLVISAGLCSASEAPRAVAEAALEAWRDSEAVALNRLAHPQLIQKLRSSRLLAFQREQKHDLSDVTALSDEQVVRHFCDAHRAVAPCDTRVEYFDRYLSTDVRGGFAIVEFDSGWRSRVSSQTHHMRNEVVLKRSGDAWLFLWSPGVNLHVDLEWDARKDLPSRYSTTRAAVRFRAIHLHPKLRPRSARVADRWPFGQE